MPKRSDTKETVLLALELMRRIPRHRKVTARELHDQLAETDLARDIRTIQRQLDMLSEHFGIERDDRTKPYGYRWKDQERGLAMPMLTPQESLLLTLAEQHLHNLLPPGLMKSMEGFFSQAKRNLAPHSPSQLEQEWLGKVRSVSSTQPLLPPKIDQAVFDTVTEALYSNHWLEIDYQNLSGKRHTALFMPLGLAQQEHRLYLVGRYRDYEDTRHLALNRIHGTRISLETYERPQDFDLDAYIADGNLGYGNGRKISLSFCIEKQAGFHLLESRLSEDQTVVEEEDHYRIQATVVDTAVLRWWLNGFGGSVWNIKVAESFGS